MDLNEALHSCRCGAHIRDDANMTQGWKICFVPEDKPENHGRPLHVQPGNFVYIGPNGLAHNVRFSDRMKSSPHWRTVP